MAGCVEITQKGDLRAVMDDFSADVQDEGDQRQVGRVPILDLAGPTGSRAASKTVLVIRGNPVSVYPITSQTCTF